MLYRACQHDVYHVRRRDGTYTPTTAPNTTTISPKSNRWRTVMYVYRSRGTLPSIAFASSVIVGDWCVAANAVGHP